MLIKPGVQNTPHFMLRFSFDFQWRQGWLCAPLKGVIMGWPQLGDVPYWVNVVHTNGEPKNKGCWACSSNNFEGPKVFVCELARRLRCPDKFCMQENPVTDLQQGCRHPHGIRRGLRVLLCDCEIFTEVRWMSERLVTSWCAVCEVERQSG